MKALGGKQAWDNTHYLRFTFAGRRTHCWDKWTGRHRVEGQDQDGKKYVVLENINTKEGTAWVDGKKVEGDKAKKSLERGYGAWVNDTYWLLMPYKLQDPGVNLAYAGEETIDGKTYDKLALCLRQGRPHPGRPLLGLHQPRHPPDGPLGLHPPGHAEGRPAAAPGSGRAGRSTATSCSPRTAPRSATTAGSWSSATSPSPTSFRTRCSPRPSRSPLRLPRSDRRTRGLARHLGQAREARPHGPRAGRRRWSPAAASPATPTRRAGGRSPSSRRSAGRRRRTRSEQPPPPSRPPPGGPT